jgi:hypothetical protein
MNKRETEECLKRAQECARQADAALDPELKIYLMKLALSWTQAAHRSSPITSDEHQLLPALPPKAAVCRSQRQHHLLNRGGRSLIVTPITALKNMMCKDALVVAIERYDSQE